MPSRTQAILIRAKPETFVKPHVIALALFVGFLLLAGCGRKEEKPLPPVAMKVGVRSVDRGDIVQSLEISGALQFLANTIVSAEIGAQVRSLEVRDGDAVKQGQVLLVFDETKIRATAEQAQGNLKKNEATLAFNKIEWEKNLELLKSGAISQTQYDQKYYAYRNTLGQVEADKAALEKALQDLNKTKVMAPIAGLLSDRYVEVGDWVPEAGKLFKISDFSKIRLEAYLSDIDVGRLNLQKVYSDGVDGELSVDPYPGKVFKGRLTYVQPVAGPGRLFLTRFYLDNPEMLLLQGMFARAKIPVEVIPGVLRVPLGALLEQVRDSEANIVFLVDNEKKARLQRIRIGASDAKNAQVLEGLQEGDLVVVEGKEILGTGQPLDISLPLRPAEESRPALKSPRS
jgi:membrane fusion protein, multidrug efflux system